MDIDVMAYDQGKTWEVYIVKSARALVLLGCNTEVISTGGIVLLKNKS